MGLILVVMGPSGPATTARAMEPSGRTALPLAAPLNLQLSYLSFDVSETSSITTISRTTSTHNKTASAGTSSRKLPAPSTTAIKALWDRGLNAYRQGDNARAQADFARLAELSSANDWTRAAGAYWAGRTAARQGEGLRATNYFAQAGTFDRTFYGQLALAKLGQHATYNWDQPTFTDAARTILTRAGGADIFAHQAAGRLSAADRRLLSLARTTTDPAVRRAGLAYALSAGLPASAFQLAHLTQSETGAHYDAGFYPTGSWLADHEYRIEPALVHAIIRQESKFDPQARSHRGATGLMQLMPETARYIINVRGGSQNGLDLTRTRDNLDVGQNYLAHLLDDRAVEGDLLRLLVAYNAGPGNLAKWRKQLDTAHDPLLFIETIPSGETRAYVERVMAAYWIYRDRLNLENPTRDLLARGVGAPMTTAAVQPAAAAALTLAAAGR